MAIGILAGGECAGLRLTGNRFDGIVSKFSVTLGVQIGFALFPSSTLQPTSGTNAAVSAKFIGSRLDDALLRDNFFGSLTVPVFVYADWGLVKLESNIVRASSNGFIFLSRPLLASTLNMANVTVAPAHVETAVKLHNALFTTLASPSFQIASAALRGIPPPANYDLTRAETVTAGSTAATDISPIQDLFDRVLTVAPAATVPPASAEEFRRAAALARIALGDNGSALQEHPLAASVPVPASAISLNLSFSAIENQAAAVAAPQIIPGALHITDNDVNAQTPGLFSGVGLFVLSKGGNRDVINLAGNTFIARSSTVSDPIDIVAGVLRASITGNIILNGWNVADFWSLSVYTTQGAITGNVLRGNALLNVPPPQQQPPLDNWYIFNSISTT